MAGASRWTDDCVLLPPAVLAEMAARDRSFCAAPPVRFSRPITLRGVRLLQPEYQVTLVQTYDQAALDALVSAGPAVAV